jgi:hypothetical protein
MLKLYLRLSLNFNFYVTKTHENTRPGYTNPSGCLGSLQWVHTMSKFNDNYDLGVNNIDTHRRGERG